MKNNRRILSATIMFVVKLDDCTLNLKWYMCAHGSLHTIIDFWLFCSLRPQYTNGLRNPPDTPNTPKDVPTAPQALRNVPDTSGPATKGKGEGIMHPTAKMGQFSMGEETKPSQNGDCEVDSSTEMKWLAAPSRWSIQMCVREAKMHTHSCSGVGRRE